MKSREASIGFKIDSSNRLGKNQKLVMFDLFLVT